MSSRLLMIWIWSLEFAKCNKSPPLCLDNDFVGALKPWEHRFGSDIFSSGNRGYILMGNAYDVKCCGYVVGWEFQASLRAQIRPITFLIWRPIQESSATFTLIAHHQFWYMKGRSRTVSVGLSEQEYISVRSGDLLGWHAPLGDVIDYRTTSDETSAKYILADDMLSVTVGMNFTFSRPVSLGRAYGIKAFVASVKQPSFINLPQKMTLKCPLEADHHVMTIDISFKTNDVKFCIDGYSPWLSVDEITGEVKTISSLRGNLTIDIHIVMTSMCDIHTSAVLTVMCTDHAVDVEKKQADTQKRDEIISQHPGFVDKPVYHVTFLESLTSEKVLTGFNFTNTRRDRVTCTLTRTQPAVPGNVIYASGSNLLVKSHYNLLYNTTPIIYANLTCILNDGNTVDEHYVIHVIKDLEPVFNNLPARIYVSAKHAHVNSVVFQVTATDSENQILTFDFLNCSCPFYVCQDGSVIVSSDLRKISKPSFSIHIFVSDGFNNIGPVYLNTVIKDINHPPQFINLPHEITVPENKHGHVLTIQSHDQDVDDNVTITWFWKDIYAAKFFTFRYETKELWINPSIELDHELLLMTINQTSFALFLTANDGSLFSDTETILIHVVDVNEGPEYSVNKINITCNEGLAGTVILDSQIRMMTTDPDINDILIFHILPSNWSEKFSLNSVTGQLTFISDYDTDPARLPSHVTLYIQVSDSGNLSSVLEISLIIKNINRAPFIVAPSSVSISEDIPGGTQLFEVSASDWDTADKLNIIIRCIDQNSCYFNTSQTGVVRLKENASLDYEMIPMFTFQVHAEDGFTTSPTLFIVVHVTDINEPPISNRDKLLIRSPEGEAGDLVSTVDLRDIFNDPDNDTLTFSLLQENKTDWFWFVIDSYSGRLYLSRNVDITREMAQLVLSVKAMAEDSQKLSEIIEIEVTFAFVNAKPILLSLPAWVTVPETRALTDVVHTVNTSDRDGDNVTLRCYFEDNSQNNVASVVVSNGEVRLVTCPPLSQGQTVHISLIIEAFDGQEASEKSSVNITIIGVNEPPIFMRNEYTYVINETQVGEYFSIQEARSFFDPDPGDKFTFFADDGGTGQKNAFINFVTWELAVRYGYDIDMDGNSNNITIQLMVVDPFGLNATTKVIIKITDINDNTPVVENYGEQFLIDYDVTPGQRIGQVLVSDLDSGKNSLLSFNLIGSTVNDTSAYFIISNYGWILSTGLMPPENHITIHIIVSDNGLPSNTATAVVYVVVAKPTNETILQLQQIHQSTSFEDDADQLKSVAIHILAALTVCSVAAIAVLSCKLWKVRKVQRSTQPEESHNAFHEYRFHWVPKHITAEGPEVGIGSSGSPLSVIPSFLRTSISNQNFQYEPAVVSNVEESEEQCSKNQMSHIQTAEIGGEGKRQCLEDKEIHGNPDTLNEPPPIDISA